MKKLFLILIALCVVFTTKTSFAVDLYCSDYYHDYSAALEDTIKVASVNQDPLTIHGFCRISRPVSYTSSGPYESLVINGDGVLYFDFFDGDALTISGHERRLPFKMSDISIKRINDGIGRGCKNVLLRRITDFSVDRVSIYGSNGFSLSIQDSQLGRVTNNTVGVTARGSGCDGIHLEAPGFDMAIANNTVYMTGDDAISVGSHINSATIDNILLDGNVVWKSDRGGIKIHEGARNVTASRNSVRDVALHCIGVTTEGYSSSSIFNIILDTNQVHDCGTDAINIERRGSGIDKVFVHGNVGYNYDRDFLRKSGGPTRVTEADNQKQTILY